MDSINEWRRRARESQAQADRRRIDETNYIGWGWFVGLTLLAALAVTAVGLIILGLVT